VYKYLILLCIFIGLDAPWATASCEWDMMLGHELSHEPTDRPELTELGDAIDGKSDLLDALEMAWKELAVELAEGDVPVSARVISGKSSVDIPPENLVKKHQVALFRGPYDGLIALQSVPELEMGMGDMFINHMEMIFDGHGVSLFSISDLLARMDADLRTQFFMSTEFNVFTVIDPNGKYILLQLAVRYDGYD